MIRDPISQYWLVRRIESALCGAMFFAGLASLVALIFMFAGCDRRSATRGPVIIQRKADIRIECPPMRERHVLNLENGYYVDYVEWLFPSHVWSYSGYCFRTERWRDEWTTTPELGGRFIRRLPD
jgi:hypothetical protein